MRLIHTHDRLRELNRELAGEHGFPATSEAITKACHMQGVRNVGDLRLDVLDEVYSFTRRRLQQ